MKELITILWCVVFAKLMFFWLWLWQLKEYHRKRFKAHFETQAIKKILSSFWRLKFPKFTKKVIVISSVGILLEISIFLYIYISVYPYIYILISIILAPVIFSLLVLFFQIPTVILQNRLLKKAKQKREKFKHLVVIGITGSYGKTSTKEFLGTILSEKFKVLKTKKHINAEIGIAKTILKELKPEHEIFIAEIGAYEREKIKQVCEILQPKLGILTGINEQHMATFGSQENIIKAKYELIESLPKKGLAVFNGNNKHCRELYQATETKFPRLARKIVYVPTNTFPAIVEKTLPWNLSARDITIKRRWLFFRAISKNGKGADFKINLMGAHNIENLLLAALAAEELGMSLEEVATACRKLKPLPGALNLEMGKNGLNILDATYSANPYGVIAHLDYLRTWQTKKVIIMPCLIELGSSSKEVHQRIGEQIGKVCDLAIITTKDRFKELKQGAVRSGMNPKDILLLEKPAQILEKIKNDIDPEDVVLLESRVPKEVICEFKK